MATWKFETISSCHMISHIKNAGQDVCSSIRWRVSWHIFTTSYPEALNWGNWPGISDSTFIADTTPYQISVDWESHNECIFYSCYHMKMNWIIPADRGDVQFMEFIICQRIVSSTPDADRRLHEHSSSLNCDYRSAMIKIHWTAETFLNTLL